MHGGGTVRREPVDEVHRLRDDVPNKRNSERASESQGFLHRGLGDRPSSGDAPPYPERRASDRADSAPSRDQHELLPDGGRDAFGHFSLDPGACEETPQPFHPISPGAVELAKDDRRLDTGMADVTGFLKPGNDTAQATDDPFGGQRITQFLRGLHTVQKRQDHRPGTDQGAHLPSRFG